MNDILLDINSTITYAADPVECMNMNIQGKFQSDISASGTVTSYISLENRQVTVSNGGFFTMAVPSRISSLTLNVTVIFLKIVLIKYRIILYSI